MQEPGFRALEFFSGVGGLHYALDLARPGSTVVAAFDQNQACNATYLHNHGIAPVDKNIETLTARALEAYGEVDLWLLSPPCQPYSRNGKQQGSKDPRSAGFLALLDRIREEDAGGAWQQQPGVASPGHECDCM